MSKYKNVHYLMIIVFLVMQAGIFPDYWPSFRQEAWAVHIHYWTATAWYALLIFQPYFATSGKLPFHRTFGMIGLFLAGGVVFTAISMFARDMRSAEFAAEFPDRIPLPPNFFYGVIGVEMIMMTAFGAAVIMAIIKRKDLENHAWWMISTVFYVAMPALGRGLFYPYDWIFGIENITWQPNTTAMTIILIGLFIFAFKYGKLKHPATYLAVIVNLFTPFIRTIGNWEWYQKFLISVIQE